MPLSFDNIFFNVKLIIKYVLNKYASIGTHGLNGKFNMYHQWYTWYRTC